MQSLHYNSGSIKLTRERATMVSRWDSNEVARWISGLAGIQTEIGEIFLRNNVNGSMLGTLLRDDLRRMGIKQFDQQLILMQSIESLLSLVNRLGTETLAALLMKIFSFATISSNLLKRKNETDSKHDDNRVIDSPELYTSISHLSEAVVETCHWLGRLPFIENIEHINLRRKIIKALVQIRFYIRNIRSDDQMKLLKTKLILEINDLRTTVISVVRENKDSLFASDCYLTRVNLRRPIKDDVNIEYTTMPNYTHIISSIETEAMNSMGSGFNAINIGDEIIEINDQVVIGWDPVHFNELIRCSSQTNEICLLVKKMPRHNDDEAYTKRLTDFAPNTRRTRARGALERQKQQQAQENRSILLEQEGEIEVESDDETLYQSKRSSQIKRDQHCSLPDLTDAPINSNDRETSNSVKTSSTPKDSPATTISPTNPDSKRSNTDRNRANPNVLPSPKSSRKTAIEAYFSMWFRSRQDSKSILPDVEDSSTKDQPQLVNLKRLNSIDKCSNHNDDPNSPSAPNNNASSTRSSISNIFRTSESSEKNRNKNSNDETGKPMTFRNELKMEIGSIFGQSPTTIVANKPPLNHSENRKNSTSTERRRPKRSPRQKKVSCQDLGKGDCEGSLYRYSPKGTLSLVQWRLFWCVLKGGVLYIFKSKEDQNQQVEIKLKGKNVSPAPERRKYAFCISDENRKTREYFSCSTRDEMAKWMNKMGLAAISFNGDDSNIAGFSKGFLDSRESSPGLMTKIGLATPTGSAADSENDSDKDSVVFWAKSNSHNSSMSDTDSCRERNLNEQENKRAHLSSFARHARSSSSSASILSDTNNASIKSNFNRFVGQIQNTSHRDDHHRTNSSPVPFPLLFDESSAINAAPRLSDSDSSTEFTHQKFFNDRTTNQAERNSTSEGATINTSSIILPVLNRFSTTNFRSNSNQNGDEDSARLVSLNFDRNFSSSSSSVATSPPISTNTVVRSSPLYISVHTTTPSIPIVKGTVSSTTHDDDELFFTRRSPSPQPPSNKPNQIYSSTIYPNQSAK